jgi:hypothetical protein
MAILQDYLSGISMASFMNMTLHSLNDNSFQNYWFDRTLCPIGIEIAITSANESGIWLGRFKEGIMVHCNSWSLISFSFSFIGKGKVRECKKKDDHSF